MYFEELDDLPEEVQSNGDIEKVQLKMKPFVEGARKQTILFTSWNAYQILQELKHVLAENNWES